MRASAVHTVHRNGHWVNEVEGETRHIDDLYACQEDAAHAGRAIARDLGARHRIHDVDGRVRDRRPPSELPNRHLG